jgi:hypothetical protein
METKKEPMEMLREEVLASKTLDSYFHQLIKEKGGLVVEDIQELMADYVMKHSTAEELVDNLELENIRVCSECSKPMTEGYCIENGAEYYCSEESLHKNLTDEEYENLYDEGRGDSYYTSWVD